MILVEVAFLELMIITFYWSIILPYFSNKGVYSHIYNYKGQSLVRTVNNHLYSYIFFWCDPPHILSVAMHSCDKI